MKMPVKGKIRMDYAVDTLTYSKTLEQYMTHHEIIARRTPVVAALDGKSLKSLWIPDLESPLAWHTKET